MRIAIAAVVAGLLLAPAAAIAPTPASAVVVKVGIGHPARGHYYWRGRHYAYRWNGGYYNYYHGGRYYNYYNRGRYWRERYRCRHNLWCYR